MHEIIHPVNEYIPFPELKHNIRNQCLFVRARSIPLKLMIPHKVCAALDDYAVVWICLLNFATSRRNACSTV